MTTLKEIITHLLAIGIILSYIFLLIKSAFNSQIQVPQILSTIALLVLGYYFGTFNKTTP